MTSVRTHLPVAYDVRQLLDDLLARRVEVRSGPPWAPLNGEPGTFGLYVDEGWVVRVVCICDARFSAYASSAMGLISRVRAEEAVERRELDAAAQESLEELLSICAALYDVDGALRVRLHQTHHLGAEVPPAAQALAAVLGRRLDLHVHIPGYGSGRLSFVGVA